ncbi:hypothetical protein ILUMI_22770 [Ignelater luminosus]|uniref:DUF4371 domain-containing protein n=1 Tax=Ignelater luminosus TaxID=2038154 RepID=A0A8K0G084_IGNLU|nr:hypothetical protein ILUMI_22770 [Ignelater luminosus]
MELAKHALKKFEKHNTSKYHRDSKVYANNFLTIKSGSVLDVASHIDCQHKKDREENRAALRPIIETILFCEEQELPLRGDDSGPISLDKPTNKDGKSRALLRFGANAVDETLKNTYQVKETQHVSAQIQNEVINIATTLIHKELVKKIKEAGCFSILVDKTIDVSGVEQMSICVRYVSTENSKRTLRDDFLALVPVHDQSAESLLTLILE